MKKVIFFAAIICLFFSFGICNATEGSHKDKNLIITDATSEASGDNDSALVSLTIVTENRILDKAVTENSTRANKVISSLKSLNLKGARFQTCNFSIQPQMDYKIKPYRIVGYQVRNTINAILEILPQAELSSSVSKIVDSSVAMGANEVSGVTFYIKNKDELERQALKQATAKAIEKAKVLAQAAGVTLKQIVTLSTNYSSQPPMPRRMDYGGMNMMKAEMAPTPIEAGESKVSAMVNLSYEIE